MRDRTPGHGGCCAGATPVLYPRTARKLAGFIAEMRKVAMKLHTKDQAPKEGGKEAPKQGPVSGCATQYLRLAHATRVHGRHWSSTYALPRAAQWCPHCSWSLVVGLDSLVRLVMWLDPLQHSSALSPPRHRHQHMSAYLPQLHQAHHPAATLSCTLKWIEAQFVSLCQCHQTAAPIAHLAPRLRQSWQACPSAALIGSCPDWESP